jgi:hypothetical protein
MHGLGLIFVVLCVQSGRCPSSDPTRIFENEDANYRRASS